MTERLHNSVEELNQADCLALLASQTYGRLGLVVDGRPEIFPLIYSLDGDHCVIFRTSAGLKLAAAINHHVVFEVDQVDPIHHTGWSVIVHGVAHQTDRILPGCAPLAPWLSDRPYLVRVTRHTVTGRQIGARPVDLQEP